MSVQSIIITVSYQKTAIKKIDKKRDVWCTSWSLGDRCVDPFLRSGNDDLRGWEVPINGVPLRPLDKRFGSEPVGVRSAKVNTWPAALSGDDE